MSLLTGQYFDVAEHDLDFRSGVKRRFFQSAELGSGWEDTGGVDDAVASRMGVISGKYGAMDLSVLMEMGGMDGYVVDEGYEDEELNMAMEP
jgi:hypothetical protein